MDYRFSTQDQQLREMIERAMSQLNTAMPGVIKSFNTANQTATVQPGIKLKWANGDGTFTYYEMPLIVNVPLVFPCAGGFAVTLPVAVDDPCLLIFSQRSIDNWLQLGGVQPPEQNTQGARHHSLTDAMAIVGIAPYNASWGSWNAGGIEVRDRARNVRCSILTDKAEMAFGETMITLDASGGKLTGTWKLNDIVLNTHTHTDPQGGNTGGPQ